MKIFKLVSVLLCFFVLLSNFLLAMEDDSTAAPPPSLNSSVVADDKSVVIDALKAELAEQIKSNQEIKAEFEQHLQSLSQRHEAQEADFKEMLDTAVAKALEKVDAIFDAKLKELQEGYAGAIKNQPASFKQTIRTDAYFWGIAFCSGAKILYDTFTNYQGIWMLPMTIASSTLNNLGNIINIYLAAKLLGAARTIQAYLPSQATRKEKED